MNGANRQMILKLNQWLMSATARGSRRLIVERGQNLRRKCWTQLRLLTHLETSTEKLHRSSSRGSLSGRTEAQASRISEGSPANHECRAKTRQQKKLTIDENTRLHPERLRIDGEKIPKFSARKRCGRVPATPAESPESPICWAEHALVRSS